MHIYPKQRYSFAIISFRSKSRECSIFRRRMESVRRHRRDEELGRPGWNTNHRSSRRGARGSRLLRVLRKESRPIGNAASNKTWSLLTIHCNTDSSRVIRTITINRTWQGNSKFKLQIIPTPDTNANTCSVENGTISTLQKYWFRIKNKPFVKSSLY